MMSAGVSSACTEGEKELSNGCHGAISKEGSVPEGVLLDVVRQAVDARDLFILDLTDNFFEIGGNLVTAAVAVRKLRERGYEIELEHFCEASNLCEVVAGMHRKYYTPYELVYGIEKKRTCDVTRTHLPCDHDVVSFLGASELELSKVFDFAQRFLVKVEPFVLASDLEEADKKVFIASALRELFNNYECHSLSFFIRHRESGDVRGVMLSADFCYQCHPSHEGIPVLPLSAYLQTLFSLEMKHRKNLEVTSSGLVACQVLSAVDIIGDPVIQLSLQRSLISESIQTARHHGYKRLIGFHGNPLIQECAAEAGFKPLDASEQLKTLQFKKTKPLANIRPANYRIVVMATDLQQQDKTDRNENVNEHS
ncbi:uncharacterized protein [Ptychodera flava]|uniref:uncharacterized protein n=1 Tax=Ptychodera flava TaxID=63121 RepID=UPI00396A5096